MKKLNLVVEESLNKVKKIHRRNRLRRITGGTIASSSRRSHRVLHRYLRVQSCDCRSSFTKLGEIFGLVENEQDYPGDYSSVSVPVP